MELSTRRRRALSTVLALLLAIESVSAVAAVGITATHRDGGTRHALPAAAPAGVVLAEQAGREASPADAAARGSSGIVRTARTALEVPDAPTLRPTARSTAAAAPVPARAPRVAARTLKPPKAPAASHRAAAASSGGGTHSSAPRTYKGRNHLWIPALGINRSTSWFSCTRSAPPANYVYRWGCAGANNAYFLGHAWGVFKPLHDAYVGGRLRKGMQAYYADSKGTTHLYTVRWWKLTRPTTDASWAWAAQGTPSMTLQTCVGANSQYRLMVRLVEVR